MLVQLGANDHTLSCTRAQAHTSYARTGTRIFSPKPFWHSGLLAGMPSRFVAALATKRQKEEAAKAAESDDDWGDWPSTKSEAATNRELQEEAAAKFAVAAKRAAEEAAEDIFVVDSERRSVPASRGAPSCTHSDREVPKAAHT